MMTKQKTAAKLSAVRIRWHEASHTVIARAAGLRVLVVTARGGRLDKYRGTTTLAPRPETTPQQFHENEIKVLLAGMLGEAKHFPQLDLQLDIMPYCASDWWAAACTPARSNPPAAAAKKAENHPQLSRHR